MKFIAHRGACLECQEDTLASLSRGADYGAYAVECDPRYTGDGHLVLFHDDDLARLAGDPRRVDELTLAEMREILSAAGKELTTLDQLLTEYKGKSAVLLDLSFSATDEAFYRKVKAAPFRVIVGVHTVEEARVAAKVFAKEDILAFMPRPEDAVAFAEAGAGNIRLWERWVDEVSDDDNPERPHCTYAEVRAALPADREIWIMSYSGKNGWHPLFTMNSSPEQIDRLTALGVDGILLNDIKTATER